MYAPVPFIISAGLGDTLVPVLVAPGLRLVEIIFFGFLLHPDSIFGLFLCLFYLFWFSTAFFALLDGE